MWLQAWGVAVMGREGYPLEARCARRSYRDSVIRGQGRLLAGTNHQPKTEIEANEARIAVAALRRSGIELNRKYQKPG